MLCTCFARAGFAVNRDLDVVNKTVAYIARVNVKLFPGVEKKIKQTIGSFNAGGYNTEIHLIDAEAGKVSIFHFIKSIWKTRAKKIIIRNDFFLFLTFFVLILKRTQGCRITIDIPTPIATSLLEMRGVKNKSLATYIKIGLFYIIYPISLLPATKILQYAEDSNYFSLGIKSKTKLIANGIAVSEIQMRYESKKNNAPLTFIGVAALADWHGFDRLIRGMHEYINADLNEKSAVKFIIIGDGKIRSQWEYLAKQLNIDHLVKFTGYKSGAELDHLFNQADIAVASLGLFRKNLNMASDLKRREYVARGLPFIACGFDIDFNPSPDFVKVIPNDESPVNIEDVILWYKNLINSGAPTKIREYAWRRLDFSVKISEMF